MRDHIRDITGEHNCLPYLKIKWPNDIYYGEKKMGGVLCNSMYIEGAYITTIGVGFNVRNKEPSICMCELFEEAIAIRVSREIILATFLVQFKRLKQLFCQNGLAGIKDFYTQHWLHSNQIVSVEHSDGDGVTSEQMVIKGLTDSGFLLAEDKAGVQFELCPDGNSLDFFSGLIKRKL